MTLETFCYSKLEWLTGEVEEEYENGDYKFIVVRRRDGSRTVIEKSAVWMRHPV